MARSPLESPTRSEKAFFREPEQQSSPAARLPSSQSSVVFCFSCQSTWPRIDPRASADNVSSPCPSASRLRSRGAAGPCLVAFRQVTSQSALHGNLRAIRVLDPTRAVAWRRRESSQTAKILPIGRCGWCDACEGVYPVGGDNAGRETTGRRCLEADNTRGVKPDYRKSAGMADE